MEQINWKVEGMDCNSCALTISKYLQGKGMQDVKVNFIGGDVSFNNESSISADELAKGINGLGYQVNRGEAVEMPKSKKLFKNHLQRFLFCLVFTIPLFVTHLFHIHALMNPYVQLALTIPVFLVGMDFFGRSAVRSIWKGIPNMNVLVAIGSIAAFVYSLYGIIIGEPEQYMFFETTATIITLVFLGNWLEDKSVATTQAALRQLAVTQKTMANMIAYDDKHEEHVFPVESKNLHVGDIILIKTGEHVPMDCKILWGEVSVNESIITGESVPVEKKMNDKLIGGSMIENGTVKAYVTAVGEDTVMSNILKMVKDAQTEKPPVQQLADEISAVFVPSVLIIALITLVVNKYFIHLPFEASLMRAIAVLVIACPCAMGLATPAAIAVGLGRAAKNGILFKNARSLEIFRNIRQVVFDKTGTLTTGKFAITGFEVVNSEKSMVNGELSTVNTATASAAGASAINNNQSYTEATHVQHSIHNIQHPQFSTDDFKRIAFSLERYSNHPIAKAIATSWKIKNDIRWSSVEEIKGLGMKAMDKEGNEYIAGSYKAAEHLTQDSSHNVYILRNNTLLGWIDVADELRPEAKQVVSMLHAGGIKTILLSGDRREKCEAVAKQLGIDEVVAEQTPAQKLEKIAAYNAQLPTAMIGDGINDAPALAKATVGISLSDATQVAMQSAQVVLMNHGLKNLPLSLGLGKHTFITIRQNLFWAFAYNIVAIPVAACGFLSPTFGALVMGLSDVVLGVNSVRLNWKKVA